MRALRVIRFLSKYVKQCDKEGTLSFHILFKTFEVLTRLNINVSTLPGFPLESWME